MSGELSQAESFRTQEFSRRPPVVTIADAGSQLTDVIYWEVVESGIPAEIVPMGELDVNKIKSGRRAVIYTGSNESVNNAGAPKIPPDLLDGTVPAFGICYGGQAIAKTLGGKVGRHEVEYAHFGEYGQTSITVDPSSVIYKGLGKARVLMSHGDSILSLPDGFRITGSSDRVIASFENETGQIVATQFHPEVQETEGGIDMLRRFLTETAGIEPEPDYTLEVALDEYMELEEAKIGEILERGDFIAGALSGGVDSMVAAKAVVTAATKLGRLDQVKFFYIDNGHTRVEDDNIIDLMRDEGMPVEKIDARYEFFHSRVIVKPKGERPRLAGPLVEEADPAIKRLIIGNIFKRIFEDDLMHDLSMKTGGRVYLMQGTNNSDIVESGGRGGDQIKGHHNVEAMDDLRRAQGLVEPLAGLMKYHVRLLGEKRYGLPEWFTTRQPFPGVGFSPRILVNLRGELPPINPELQDQVDKITDELTNGRNNAHVVHLNTVGQKGDGRSLANVIFVDGEPDWQLLPKLSKEITDRSNLLNRVFYVPGLTIDRQIIQGVLAADDERFTEELREIEEIHRQAMLSTGLDPYLTQHFVGTFGVHLTGSAKPTLGLRLFISGKDHDKMVVRRRGISKETFRTGVAAIPGKQIDQAAFDRLIDILNSNLRYHSSVAYDLTDKPPGTTEWE